jgi:hypothetical protein
VGIRGHRSAYLCEEFLSAVQVSRDERSIPKVARILEFFTSLGYLVGPHHPGAASNRVRFSTDAREIGGRQGPEHLPDSFIRIPAKSVYQSDYQANIAAFRFQQHCWRGPSLLGWMRALGRQATRWLGRDHQPSS